MVLIIMSSDIPEDNGWPKDQHIATSWSIGYMTGNRVGTKYWYEHNWWEGRNDKGFRWRPKYLEHLRRYREALAALGDE